MFIQTGQRADFPTLDLHRTMPDQIFHKLALDIIEGYYEPGERLHEQPLALLFKVSRAPLREAFRILEKHGLVTIEPQKGARVGTLSVAELQNLFEIRSVLVGLATERAASNRTAELEETLRTALSSLKEVRTNATQYSLASSSATIEIARLSMNPELEKMIISFAYRIGRYTRMGLGTQQRRDQSYRNWEKLISAMIAGQVDQAVQAQKNLAYDNYEEALKIINK